MAQRVPLLFGCLFGILHLVGYRYWESTSLQISSGSIPTESLVFRVVPILIILGGVFVFDSIRRFTAAKALISKALYRVLLLYIFISLFAALAVSNSFSSAWKSIEILTLTYASALLYSLKFTDKMKTLALNVFFSIAVVFCMWILCTALIWPHLALTGNGLMIRGIIPKINPNALAFIALVCLCYVAIIRKLSFFTLSIASILLLLLFLERSRTAFAAMAFLGAIWFFIQPVAILLLRKKVLLMRIVGASFFVFALTGVMLFGGRKISDFVSGSQSKEELYQLSHRTVLWYAGYLSIKESPWIGYGILQETRVLSKKYADLFEGIYHLEKYGAGNMHNSLLEGVLGAGILGSFPFFLWFYYHVFRKGARWAFDLYTSNRKPITVFLDVCLILFFFKSLTGANLAYMSFELNLLLFLYGLGLFHNR